MAFTGQASAQAPHLTHFSVSMTWGFLISPVMAPTGQIRAHLVQPMHLPASMTNSMAPIIVVAEPAVKSTAVRSMLAQGGEVSP